MNRVNSDSPESLHNEYGVTPDVDGAFSLAYELHNGQTRLTGRSTIRHPLEVMGIVRDMGFGEPSYERIALLHDTDEDSEDGLDLRMRYVSAGCSNGEIDDIYALSHDKSDHYIFEYVLPLVSYERRSVVKLADNKHNVIDERIPTELMTPRRQQKRQFQVQSLGGLLMAHLNENDPRRTEGWAEQVFEEVMALPEAEEINWDETRRLFVSQ